MSPCIWFNNCCVNVHACSDLYILVIQAAVTREYSEDKIRNISDKLREVSPRHFAENKLILTKKKVKRDKKY